MEQLKFAIDTSIEGWNLLNIDDYKQLNDYNERQKTKEKKNEILVHLLPEPFIGNLENAKVIFLAYNPGYRGDIKNKKTGKVELGEDDWHMKPNFQKLIIDNLNVAQVKYPYYYLNPDKEFEKTPGHIWAKIIFKALIEKIDLEKLAENMACIQFFGYHSKSKKVFTEKLPSQEIVYKWLSNRLHEANPPLIVIMRSQKEWYSKIGGLQDYQKKITLKNYQRPYITQNNIKIEDQVSPEEIRKNQKKKFDEILNALNR